jgi:hypothetical protein
MIKLAEEGMDYLRRDVACGALLRDRSSAYIWSRVNLKLTFLNVLLKSWSARLLATTKC